MTPRRARFTSSPPRRWPTINWPSCGGWTRRWASSAGLAPATYDGDTPQRDRAATRKRARLVLTNPDMLHTGILPHHLQWAELFSNLRYVVIDELHAYRGVFGSHFANVLRRLRRICQFHGSDPQFLCASATIANPTALAERLIEAPVTLIDDGRRAQGRASHRLLQPAAGRRRAGPAPLQPAGSRAHRRRPDRRTACRPSSSPALG